jgi:hypothetical protein
MGISSLKTGAMKRSLLVGNEAFSPTRALFAGGSDGSSSLNVIDYITVTTTGNATDFGDMTVSHYGRASGASSTRGVWATSGSNGNVIDYVTIMSTGNAIDFGDLGTGKFHPSGCSSSTRAIFAGGQAFPTYYTSAEYITIATTGNGTNFGDLTVSGTAPAGLASTTRGVYGGRFNGSLQNVIDYYTIATTGAATDFGDLTQSKAYAAGASNSTRGIFFGGQISGNYVNVIEYITIATTGNATDFGDLLTVSEPYGNGAAASPTRAVVGPSYVPYGGSVVNTLQYVEIATTGNAVDFGDSTVARQGTAAVSNGHGGL